MIRVSDLDSALDFFCNKLGLVEVRRSEHKKGRFTLVFLAGEADLERAKATKTPMLELTYNWPDENGHVEEYGNGRNFGHLAYAVDNIYELCKKLMDAGVVINRPPRCGHMAFVKAPNGISLELIQKGGDLPPQEPWLSMENSGSW